MSNETIYNAGSSAARACLRGRQEEHGGVGIAGVGALFGFLVESVMLPVELSVGREQAVRIRFAPTTAGYMDGQVKEHRFKPRAEHVLVPLRGALRWGASIGATSAIVERAREDGKWIGLGDILDGAGLVTLASGLIAQPAEAVLTGHDGRYCCTGVLPSLPKGCSLKERAVMWTMNRQIWRHVGQGMILEYSRNAVIMGLMLHGHHFLEWQREKDGELSLSEEVIVSGVQASVATVMTDFLARGSVWRTMVPAGKRYSGLHYMADGREYFAQARRLLPMFLGANLALGAYSKAKELGL